MNSHNYFLSLSEELLCVCDKQGNFVELSPGWDKVLGYSNDEILRHPFMNFVYPQDKEKTITVFQDLKSGADIINFKNRYMKKDGSLIWLSWRAKLGLDHDYIYAIAKEVTEEQSRFLSFKKLQEISQVGSWRLDVKTNEVTWSEQTYKIHGLPYGEPCSLDEAINFYREDVRDFITKKVEIGIANGKGWQEELPFINAQGEEIWIRTIGMPYYENGELTELFGTFQDITKTKTLEIERESQNRYLSQYHDALNSFSLCFYLNERGELEDQNDLFEKVFSNCTYNDLFDLMEDANEVKEIKECIHQFKVKKKKGTYKFIQENKEIMHLDCFFYFMEHLQRYLVIAQDVTEQVKQGELNNLIIKTTNDGVWDWWIQEDYEYMSPRFWEILGYDYRTKKHHPSEWQNIIIPEDGEQALKEFQKHVESKGSMPYDLEVRYRHKLGHVIWIRCAGKIVRWSSDGRPLRMVGTHTDITSSKKAELYAIEKRKEAEKAVYLKSRFLSNISHEIRTPMNAIMGLSELLVQKNSKIDNETLESLQTIYKSSEHLLHLFNDILDLSKIETGNMNMHKSFVAAQAYFENLIHLYKAHYDSIDEQINLNFHCENMKLNKLQIFVDGNRLSQVLHNLINNAIKFSNNSSVQVDVYFEEDKLHDLQFKVDVIDQGLGIKEEDISKIFAPFSQIDSSLIRNHQGAGLGLSISKEIITLMGMDLSVESEEGVGTTFTIKGKFSSREYNFDRKYTNVKKEDLNDYSGLKVLIAEDNKVNQMVMKKMISQFNVHFTIVENGQEALMKVKESDFDLILLDLQMPVMDGVSAYLEMKKSNKQLPRIVAFTANADEEEKKRILKMGFNDYATKPISLKRLEKILSQCHFDHAA